MQQHASVTQDWADGTYTFRLGLAEIEEIERKFDKSLFVLASDLRLRTAKAIEIVDVLRVGLIGGGTKPAQALALVRRYVDERPLEENRDAAYAVVLAGLTRVHASGERDDEPGEADAAGSPNGSTSPQSTETPS